MTHWIVAEVNNAKLSLVISVELMWTVCGGLRKAIQSLRLRLRSGLRQSGRSFETGRNGMAEAMPLRKACGRRELRTFPFGGSGKVAAMAGTWERVPGPGGAAGVRVWVVLWVGAVRSVAYRRAVCAAEVGWWVRGMGSCYLGHPLPRLSAKNAYERGTR